MAAFIRIKLLVGGTLYNQNEFFIKLDFKKGRMSDNYQSLKGYNEENVENEVLTD